MVSSVRSGHAQGSTETVVINKVLASDVSPSVPGFPGKEQEVCVPPVSRPSAADCRGQKVQLSGKGWHRLAIKSEGPRSA